MAARVGALSSLSLRGGEEPKMSSREFSSISCVDAIVAEVGKVVSCERKKKNVDKSGSGGVGDPKYTELHLLWFFSQRSTTLYASCSTNKNS